VPRVGGNPPTIMVKIASGTIPVAGVVAGTGATATDRRKFRNTPWAGGIVGIHKLGRADPFGVSDVDLSSLGIAGG
jgi:hypothetical protein